jgi:hypothetical protein
MISSMAFRDVASFKIRLIQAVAALVLLGSLPARADLVEWNGAGANGVDPYGHAWLAENSAFQGVTSWGIPGRGHGVTTFVADRSVTGVQVSFFDLPMGVTIRDDGFQSFGPTMNVSPFSVSDLWVRTLLSPTSVRFDPPTPNRTLDPLDALFMYVPFTAEVNLGTFRFEALYELTPVVFTVGNTRRRRAPCPWRSADVGMVDGLHAREALTDVASEQRVGTLISAHNH